MPASTERIEQLLKTYWAATATFNNEVVVGYTPEQITERLAQWGLDDPQHRRDATIEASELGRVPAWSQLTEEERGHFALYVMTNLFPVMLGVAKGLRDRRLSRLMPSSSTAERGEN
jgi:hypothetical protein